MLNFLIDMAPSRNHLQMTIRLAGVLQEKRQKVYYTHTSSPAFTSAPISKRISNCVHYPDDLNWFKPDLTLLDCRQAVHAPLYRQLGINYIFVAMQLPDRENQLDNEVPVLYLPPVLSISSGYGPRMNEMVKRLQGIKKEKDRHIIIGLMEKGNDNTRELEGFYKVIKRSCIKNPQYQFILLTELPQTVRQLFELPGNMEVFRTLNLNSILPLCDVALTASHPDAWLDCSFAQIPVLSYSPEEMANITPAKLEQQIEHVLQNKVILTQKAQKLCDLFERENRKINQIADMLIERAERNKYNSCRHSAAHLLK